MIVVISRISVLKILVIHNLDNPWIACRQAPCLRQRERTGTGKGSYQPAMNRPCCPRASAKSLASHRARSRPHPAGTAPLTAVPCTWIQHPWSYGHGPTAGSQGYCPGAGPRGIDRLAPRGRCSRLRGLGPHKNFIDRSGTVRSKGGPVGEGRMPAALTRASELSWDLVRRTPQVATRRSRSHIPGSRMHPSGDNLNPVRGRVQRYPAPVE